MRDYGKISVSIWGSQRFQSLTDAAKLFYLYLHTCPHVNSIGCFRLPKGYAYEDLGWDIEDIDRAIEDLCKALLIEWNETEKLVRIDKFLVHSPITNLKHGKGAAKLALGLPDCELKQKIINELRADKYCSELPEMAVSNTPIDSPMHTTETETETETDSMCCDDSARGIVEIPHFENNSTKPADLIAAFDQAYLEAFGQRRPYPMADDITHASRWAEAGVTADTVRDWFLEKQQAKAAAKQQPIVRLAFGKDAIPEFHNRRISDERTANPKPRQNANGSWIEAANNLCVQSG